MKNPYDKIRPMLYKMIAEKIKNAKYVLDVGCGNCELDIFLAKKLRCKIVGIDVNEGDITEAGSKTIENDVSDLVECIRNNAHNLKTISDDTFDVAILLYTLHELERPIKSLKQVKRVLISNAKLLILDFIKGSEAEKMWAERYYMPREIKSMLKRVGFEEIKIEYPYKKELIFAVCRKV